MLRCKDLEKEMIQIDKGVQMPTRMPRNDYPFAQMEVGDSFGIPVPEGQKAASAARRMYAAVQAHSKRANNGTKYAVRTMGDQVRVWRTA
jgi:hypothetical protein